MENMDISTRELFKRLREKQNEIKIELDNLIKNTLDADKEELYLMMSNFNFAVTFLLDFTYKTKEEIDAHFENQKESIELLESREFFNIVDIEKKRLNKCIMDYFYIKLKSCNDCNFQYICNWIKRDNKTNSCLAEINLTGLEQFNQVLEILKDFKNNNEIPEHVKEKLINDIDKVFENIDETNKIVNESNTYNDYSVAIRIIQNELKKDKSGGSMYFAWQSNLACIIMDNSDLSAEKSNEIACKFLNRLIGDE